MQILIELQFFIVETSFEYGVWLLWASLFPLVSKATTLEITKPPALNSAWEQVYV